MREIRWHYRHSRQTAAADAVWGTDLAITATPTQSISTDPPVKFGTIDTILLRLNWANAVTLDDIAFFSDAQANDYESYSHLIYRVDPGDRPADDDWMRLYQIDAPFHLTTLGTIYLITDYSGACGNIQASVFIAGRGWAYGG